MKYLITILLVISALQFAPLWYAEVDPNLQFAAKLSLLLISLALLAVELISKDSKKTKSLENDLSKNEEQIKTLSKELEGSQGKLLTSEAQLKEIKLKLEKLELESAREISDLDANYKSIKNALNAAENQIEKFKKEISSASKEEQGILDFIELLQRNGRFMDFVMGDITSIDDQTVGAASRVVHQGLSSLVKEFMSVESIRNEAEGESVQVGSDEALFNYNFIGGDDLSLPKEGRLVHKGWRISKLNLPKRTEDRSAQDKVVQRAEVEI